MAICLHHLNPFMETAVGLSHIVPVQVTDPLFDILDLRNQGGKSAVEGFLDM